MARSSRSAIESARAYTALAVRGWLAVRLRLAADGATHETKLDGEGRVVPRCNQGAGRATFDRAQPTLGEPDCRRCLRLRVEDDAPSAPVRWITPTLELGEHDRAG